MRASACNLDIEHGAVPGSAQEGRVAQHPNLAGSRREGPPGLSYSSNQFSRRLEGAETSTVMVGGATTQQANSTEGMCVVGTGDGGGGWKGGDSRK